MFRDSNDQFDLGLAIVIDNQDRGFVTGRTSSFGAQNDLLMLQYDAPSGQIVDQGIFDVLTEMAQGQAMALDSAQNIIVAGTTRADPSGFMDSLILRYPSMVGCPADLTGSADPNDPGFGIPDGILDGNDFFYYLDRFAAGDLSVADLTGSIDPNDRGFDVPDGVLDASDFFFYLDLFAAGCP